MSVPRPILIDDADTRISYGGKWFQDVGSYDTLGTHGPTFNHTLSGTSHDGSISFKFNGTSVQLLGTTIPSQYGNNSGPTWECYIDNLKFQGKPPSEEDRNHYILCDYDILASGEHELYLNVTTHGQTFWFDFIQFNPIPGDSYESAVVLVDNLDPSIMWGSGWHAFTDSTGSNLTNTHESTLRLDFIGTSITWVSWVTALQPHPASTASYSLDGDPPVIFNLPGLPANTTDDLYNVHSFTRSPLSPGSHSIVVTYLGNETVTPLVLDYFLIGNTTLSRGEIKLASTSKPLVGPIVGGVVGGIALLALIGLALFLWKRRRPKQAAVVLPIGFQPFMETRNDRGLRISQATFAGESLYHPMSQQSFSQDHSYGSTSPYLPVNSKNPSQPSITDSAAASGSSHVRRKVNSQSTNAQPEPIIAQHRDSGIRTQLQLPSIEVPPRYSEG